MWRSTRLGVPNWEEEREEWTHGRLSRLSFAPSTRHGEMHGGGAKQRSRARIGGRNRGTEGNWSCSNDAVWRRMVAGIHRGGRRRGELQGSACTPPVRQNGGGYQEILVQNWSSRLETRGFPRARYPAPDGHGGAGSSRDKWVTVAIILPGSR